MTAVARHRRGPAQRKATGIDEPALGAGFFLPTTMPTGSNAMPILTRLFRNLLCLKRGVQLRLSPRSARQSIRQSILLPLLIAATTIAAFSFPPRADAQAIHQSIESPSGAPFVRLRWPETTLGPAAIGKLIAISNAAGQSLPFSVQIAPEDQGHTMHPMWVLIRLDGGAPYYLDVGHDLNGAYKEDADAVTGRHIGSLAEFSLATIRADAWGPILATLEDAQSAQQSTDAGWRRWIVVLAVIGLILIGAIIAMFARLQSRRDDVSKL